MSSGFTLLSVLLALALGSTVTFMALGLHFFSWVRLQRLQIHQTGQEARFVLFELARDLRMFNQAGCTPLTEQAELSTQAIRIDYSAPGMQIQQLEKEDDRITVLKTVWPLAPKDTPTAFFISSCQGVDKVHVGKEIDRVERSQQHLTLFFKAGQGPFLEVEKGHHLRSLTVGAAVSRRYALTADKRFIKQDKGMEPVSLLENVDIFSIHYSQDEGIFIIRLQQSKERPWFFSVASRIHSQQRKQESPIFSSARGAMRGDYRQRGMVLVFVMVVLLAMGLLMQTSQYIVSNEQKIEFHQEEWWQVLQYAEAALNFVERRVFNARQTESIDGLLAPQAVFSAQTHQPEVNRCSYKVPLQLNPTRSKAPCFVVELLDENFHGAQLYRIQVLAIGRSERTRINLQSYYSVKLSPDGAKEGQRIAWQEDF